MAENNELAVRVIRQLEYYFGDANLFWDKRMLDAVKKQEGGWIPLDTLMSFRKLSQLSNDKAFVANCVANSNSDLIELNEARDSVRRKLSRPIPARNAETQKLFDVRTVYVEQIPKAATLDDIIAFMEENYGPVDRIRRIYYKPSDAELAHQTARIFSGCAFVCFKSREYQTKILTDRYPVFGGNVLRKMTLVEYNAKKQDAKHLDELSQQVWSAKGTLIRISDLPLDIPLENVLAALRELKWNVGFVRPLDEPANSLIVRLKDVNSAKQAMEQVNQNGKLRILGMELKCEYLAGEYEKAVLEALLRNRMGQSSSSRVERRLCKVASHWLENAENMDWFGSAENMDWLGSAENMDWLGSAENMDWLGNAENMDFSDMEDDEEEFDEDGFVDNESLYVPSANRPPPQKFPRLE